MTPVASLGVRILLHNCTATCDRPLRNGASLQHGISLKVGDAIKYGIASLAADNFFKLPFFSN
jgi:hypothetical protein